MNIWLTVALHTMFWIVVLMTFALVKFELVYDKDKNNNAHLIILRILISRNVVQVFVLFSSFCRFINCKPDDVILRDFIISQKNVVGQDFDLHFLEK